jgi:translation elongation factor P/translation initiation factor 5A
MKYINNLVSPTITFALVLFFLNSYSQEPTYIKYLDLETIDKVEIDYDNDGDLDFVIAGVFVKKNQGRVYLIENIGLEYNKPEHLFSFPSIGLKQKMRIDIDGETTTIRALGTSPEGKQESYTATLNKGIFQGLTIPPVSTKAFY